ncbi:hypothetical protein [Streptomyces sp. SID3343]|uniref:hypothetical protein n=1 Tax=Streptomyces sp. SID3343 TaxID=2690260 RepID=UPI00136B2891|nr:hypothetical protein [Streptomyces sp. SID3343]MYW00581.1 hypothetical protein [Streptomyces sp. SID3343]
MEREANHDPLGRGRSRTRCERTRSGRTPVRPGRSAPTAAAFSTTLADGDTIEYPASINGIREALPPESREKFDEEVGNAHARDLLLVLHRWALLPTPAWDEDVEKVEALRAEERQVLEGCEGEADPG